MYNPYMHPQQNPHYLHPQVDHNGNQSHFWNYSNPMNYVYPYSPKFPIHNHIMPSDYGTQPFVTDINKSTKLNNAFRTALWTGTQFQITLMSIDVGEDIGLEMHPDVDQFLRIEQGQGLVQMGNSRDRLTFRRPVTDDSAIIIPAGTWHNLSNTGSVPLKLYSIYAPPNHPFGTVHPTKKDSIAAEAEHGHYNGYPFNY